MCRTSTLLLLLLGFTTAFAVPPGDPKGLTVPDEQLERARKLVRELDDNDGDVRELATTELSKMGRLALPVVLEALKGDPPSEIAIRGERILPDLKVDDFNARYPVFLADKEGKYQHDLPGWNELVKAAKDTPESRQLFADILASDECREMLVQAVGMTWEKRKEYQMLRMNKFLKWLKKTQLANTDPEWPVEWNMAALLADLIYGRDYSDDIRVMALRGTLKTTEGKLAAEGKGRYGKAPLGLIRYWMAEQKGPYGLSNSSQLVPVLKLGDDARLGYLEQILRIEATNFREHAMDELAKTGNRKYIANLKKLFEYTTDKYRGVITENDGTPRRVQWRDSALALCLVLTEQKLSDYGFTEIPYRDKSPWISFKYLFKEDSNQTADEKREAAFKKWAEWEKANPESLKAPPAKKDK